ncbi:MAG: patatin-like phospholipase family protein [Paludibacterium sp.]|uniref:patatin-like phospholipase family protein n=1 Tax=Paludibacterium sp. TaxID=1917523 RepID=UPI0025E66C60|nr:patatin-like phospholipase family protein [Paludibacterium sp.]MBV8047108.1 patatin-like phospholipase family protein [Paludibacterium sp.]MBV8648807.1 patatin-like phospholipase family protein [Paludibacterium sp.]
MIRTCTCLLLSLSFLAFGAQAAEAPPPRIGVVLGGGGARGFAHLGVLRELEKLHIPIACIAGTSAGALIGGMYANGLPLDEMQQSFKDADWNAMLSGKPDRAQVPYERKNDDYRNYFDITFGVHDGVFRVPRSAINSQDVDLYLRQLTRDRTVDSFDHLPIPFRAVATDLSNGDAVVFDHGSLATALRASMAVPGLFDPVSDQGRLLIDGGVARNLPIEDLKHRCADHVIVVDVGTPLMKTDQIHNLFDVLAQTSNLLVTRNVRQQKALLDDQDIVIRPDLNGYSSASFADNQAIIARGAAAVAPVRERLKAWSVPPDAYQAWHTRLTEPAPPKIDRIEVVSPVAGHINAERLASALGQDDGQAGNLDGTRQKLRSLFAGGDYDSLSYRIQDIDGRSVMQVLPVERAVGPTYLRFGMNLKSSTTGDSSVNFLASSLSTWLNAYGATWRNDVQLGTDTAVRSEFYQPLGLDSPMFVAARANYQQVAWPFFDDNHHKYAQLDLSESGGALDAGVALGKYGQLRGGPYWVQYDPSVNMGQLQPSQSWLEQKTTEAGLQLSAIADQFDNPRWPRSGYFFDSNLRYGMPDWTGVNTRYYGLTAENATTFGDVTWRLTGKLKGNLDVADPNHFNTPQFLGGFLNLSGYQQDELYGEKVGLARAMVYWRAATLPSALGSGLYAGASLEMGKVWRRNFGDQDTEWLPGGSLFLGADTILGPFFVGVGSARGGRPIGYMYLGFDY